MRHFLLFAHALFLSSTLFFYIQTSVDYQTPAFSANDITKLNINRLPMFKLYDNSPITFQNAHAYQDLIEQWQAKLNRGSEKLFENLYQELQVTAEDVYEGLHNPCLVAHYHISRQAELYSLPSVVFIEEEDADPEIISFIRNIIQRYTTKKNIKIILTDAISNLTTTYGSDLYEHYLFCYLHTYTKENIKNYYNSISQDNKLFYLEHISNTSIRWIDISNLFILELIHAASQIQHQTNLLNFIITSCSYQGKEASAKTSRLCVRLNSFMCLLEAILQSINPLESALFIRKSTNIDQNLWNSLVRNIAQTYSTKSLKKFKLFAQQIKQQST